MATMDVRHPDVLEFVQAKREDGRLRQFNLSLLITKEFIEAVRHDEEWRLIFPIAPKEVSQISDDSIVWADWPSKEEVLVNEQGLVACKVYKSMLTRSPMECHHEFNL